MEKKEDNLGLRIKNCLSKEQGPANKIGGEGEEYLRICNVVPFSEESFDNPPCKYISTEMKLMKGETPFYICTRRDRQNAAEDGQSTEEQIQYPSEFSLFGGSPYDVVTGEPKH